MKFGKVMVGTLILKIGLSLIGIIVGICLMAHVRSIGESRIAEGKERYDAMVAQNESLLEEWREEYSEWENRERTDPTFPDSEIGERASEYFAEHFGN